jgi:hypothetical protein
MPDIHLTCRLTGKPFTVSEWEQEHLKKFDAPLPDLCPEERHRKRLSHRNERRLYKRNCSMTGEPVISVFSPDKDLLVYRTEAWRGDAWDGRDYGIDYDFSKPFFEQFAALQRMVPHMALLNVNGENSEYCNITTGNKNCYLVFGGDFCEDCRYSVFSMHCRDVSDVYWVNGSELVYDTLDSENCYNIRYSQKAFGCRDSSFLFECRNCENCFGCVGLVGKKYHIFNKPYPPEEYKEKIKAMRLDTWSGVENMRKEFTEFKLQFPHRYVKIINSEHCTGDDISGAKNCENCFGIYGPAEDLKDIFLGGWGLNDSASSDHIGHKAELFYEMLGSIDGSHCAFCTFSWSSQDTFYCNFVLNSHDLFGCSNLKRAEYCILNKQYSKEDYFALRGRIVEHMKSTGEWGQFFPAKNSLFAYNETVAQDYFPLTKEAALAQGLRWFDEEKRALTPNDLPDSIHDITDEILSKTLVCEKTGRPYKIIPSELKLYRQMEIPIPRYAPETRNEIRIASRNPIQTWTRQCAKCAKPIETTYAPDRPEKVYCEACYLAEIY